MNKFNYCFLVVVTTALMGSVYAIGKMGLSYSSPLLLIAFRFTLAGLIMIPFVLRFPHPKSASGWGKMALIGLFQTVGVMSAIFLSLKTITAGESSILTFINPLFVVILSTLFLQARYRFTQWAGVGIGIAGIVTTLGFQVHLKSGTLLGLLSAVFFSIGTLLIKLWGKELNTWVLTAYQMLFGGLVLLAGSFLFENPYFIVTQQSVFIVLWMAIMASIVQFAGWFYLLSIGDPGKTSAFLFLAPFFGVITGWVLLDEVIEPYVYAGGLLIFVGIFLVNWTFSKRRA